MVTSPINFAPRNTYLNLKKDYYKILHIPPNATTEEIKKAYKKLAIKYHPDKNLEDKVAAAVFMDMVEAYNTLQDYEKRRTYDLDYRTYYKFVPASITGYDIVHQAKTLKDLIAHSDPYRMNTDAVYLQLQQILSNENILILNENLDDKSVSGFAEDILHCCVPLTYAQAEDIIGKMQLLKHYTAVSSATAAFKKQQFQQKRFEKYKVLIAFAITCILTLIIYLLNR